MSNILSNVGKICINLCIVGATILLTSLAQNIANAVTAKALDTIISIKKSESTEAETETQQKEPIKVVA